YQFIYPDEQLPPIAIHRLLFFAFLFVSAQAMGQHQRKEITGIVIDTSGGPLQGVNVRLSSILDTMLVTTSEKGAFKFSNIIGPDFRLTFSMIGYQILDKVYQPNKSSAIVQLLPKVLRPQQTLL